MHTSDWEERVDRAWATCSEWWDSEPEHDDAVQFRFSGLTCAVVARALHALKERSLWHREGVLRTPESFDENRDEDCAETEESLEQVREGRLAALTLHYWWQEAHELPLELFTTVTGEHPDDLRVTVLAVWRLIGTPTHELETKFRMLLEHAHELMTMFDTAALELARKVRGELSKEEGWLRVLE